MKNNLGRKSMAKWLETVQGVTGNLYNDAFQTGYDVAKDETLDVDSMAQLIVDRYTNSELCDLMMAIDKICPHVPNKTPNQQRKELIEKARVFVVNWIKNKNSQQFNNRKFPAGLWFTDDSLCFKTIQVDWFVNTQKNAVTCIIKNSFGGCVRSKGIAKCHPDEVFNADIGKAIALARALEIDVPIEFLEAVQPDEAVIGMKVQPTSSDTGDNIGETLEVVSLHRHRHHPTFESGRYASHYKLTDDTNAQYT